VLFGTRVVLVFQGNDFSIALFDNFYIKNVNSLYFLCFFDEKQKMDSIQKQKMIYIDRDVDSYCNYWNFGSCYHT
jgi:hypothetical protein